MGPLTFELPKYAQIVNALQQRTTDGDYPPGSAIPERGGAGGGVPRLAPGGGTGVGHPAAGWVGGVLARTRPFRAHPPWAGRPPGQPAGRSLLAEEGIGTVKVLDVGIIDAPPRAAAALDVAVGTPVLARRRLVRTRIGPVELGVSYVAAELAAGTDLAQGKALGSGMLEHLRLRKNVMADHASERISARAATAEESRLLEIARRECVLTVLVVAFDVSGTPLLATDAVLPASRRELEDTFPIA